MTAAEAAPVYLGSQLRDMVLAPKLLTQLQQQRSRVERCRQRIASVQARVIEGAEEKNQLELQLQLLALVASFPDVLTETLIESQKNHTTPVVCAPRG